MFHADDGFVGIDCDKVCGGKNEKPLLDGFSTYREYSVSGKGLHFIGKATLPDNAGRKKQWLELYSTGRFFTMTGRKVDDFPIADLQPHIDATLNAYFPKAATTTSTTTTPLNFSDEKILELIRAEKDTTKFEALWSGDIPTLLTMGFASPEDASRLDTSKADFSLCGKLAFYCADFDQILRLVQNSALWHLGKWHRPDYCKRTINGVLTPDRERYKPPSAPIREPTVDPFVFADDDDDTILLTLSEIRRRAAIMKNTKKWAAEKWIQIGKIGLLHGRAKKGKSTALMDLTASLLSGGKWLNLILCSQMPVLMIDYENEEDYQEENLVPMIEAKGMNPDDAEKLLYVIDPQRIKEELSPYPVERIIAYIEIIKVLSGHTFGIFIIDTARPAFNNFFDESNWEWSADRVRTALDLAHATEKATGWGGIVVHHTGKAGNGPSGSGDWEGAVDYAIAYDLNDSRTQAKMSWSGRQIDPPGDLVITKEGSVLTGRYKDKITRTEQAMDDITIKTFVTTTPQSQRTIIKMVQNGWQGADVPGKDKITDSLHRMATSGEIQSQMGKRRALEYWI